MSSYDRYPKHGWLMSSVPESDIHRLYLLREATRTPMTKLLKEAVFEYLKRNEKKHNLKGETYEETR